MSTYVNRNKSLVGCLFAVGLMGGLSSVVMAGEDSSDHSSTAKATNKPATTANELSPITVQWTTARWGLWITVR